MKNKLFMKKEKKVYDQELKGDVAELERLKKIKM